jgi:hypothetical protein
MIKQADGHQHEAVAGCYNVRRAKWNIKNEEYGKQKRS